MDGWLKGIFLLHCDELAFLVRGELLSVFQRAADLQRLLQQESFPLLLILRTAAATNNTELFDARPLKFEQFQSSFHLVLSFE